MEWANTEDLRYWVLVSKTTEEDRAVVRAMSVDEVRKAYRELLK